jgi:hypothetical protein
MLKKFSYVLLFCLLLAGCSSSAGGKSVISMDSIIKAFEKKGAKIDSNEKPMFSVIGAKDGVIFYVDDQPVKVYEFDSEKALKTAEESMPAMKDWERNGLFVLETSHNESKKIFKNVK